MKPTSPQLYLGADGQLRAHSPDGPIQVRVTRCFPWTAPDRYFSLRDSDGKEIAWIDDPAQLEPASQAALQRALALTSFVFSIRRILSVEQDIELRVWSVQTDRGNRRFQTELDQWPEPVAGGGWLLRDVTGDLYRFPPLNHMDRASRRLFWPFQD
ncbi:MAG: DUF1854 domain-containing protein [Candidatus Methylacidiphilales bacterium]